MADALPLLLSARQAASLIGFGERMFHQLRKREGFPNPIVLGPRAVRWRREEIEKWIGNLPAETGPRNEPRQLCTARKTLKARPFQFPRN
jgi:predicted DNA-binding transcriptional regulator AlpA